MPFIERKQDSLPRRPIINQMLFPIFLILGVSHQSKTCYWLGTPRNFWLGVPGPVLQTYFRPKYVIFRYPFTDLASKTHTRFCKIHSYFQTF